MTEPTIVVWDEIEDWSEFKAEVLKRRRTRATLRSVMSWPQRLKQNGMVRTMRCLEFMRGR